MNCIPFNSVGGLWTQRSYRVAVRRDAASPAVAHGVAFSRSSDAHCRRSDVTERLLRTVSQRKRQLAHRYCSNSTGPICCRLVVQQLYFYNESRDCSQLSNQGNTLVMSQIIFFKVTTLKMLLKTKYFQNFIITITTNPQKIELMEFEHNYGNCSMHLPLNFSLSRYRVR